MGSLPRWEEAFLERRLHPEEWKAPESWFYRDVADKDLHNLKNFLQRHFGLEGRMLTDVPDVLRNAPSNAWVAIPLPDAWHEYMGQTGWSDRRTNLPAA